MSDVNSTTETLVVKVETEDMKQLERCAYEAVTAKHLIEYFVGLCKDAGTAELLDGYIAGYRKDLAAAEMHRLMLQNKIMDQYFPDERGWAKQQTSFAIDFERKEIVYTYAPESAAEL